MKKRSEMARDFMGGFFGGITGFMLFRLLLPTIPWLGVIGGLVGGLVGVFLSWNAEEISEGVTSAKKRAQVFCNSLFGGLCGLPRLPKISLFGSILKYVKKVSNIKEAVGAIFRICVSSIKARAIAEFRKAHSIFIWLLHPSSMAIIHSIAAAVFVWIVHVFALCLLWCSFCSENFNLNDFYAATFFGSIVFLGFSSVYLTTRIGEDGLWSVYRVNFRWVSSFEGNRDVKKFHSIERLDRSMRAYYKRCEAYESNSWVFTHEVISFLKAEFICIFGMIYWIPFGSMVVIFITFPISMAVFFMCQLYNLATKTRWWLCAHVTTVVLSLSFILFHDYVDTWFASALVAMGVGFTSGTCTLLMRKAIMWWGETKVGTHYLVDVCYNDEEWLPVYVTVSKGRFLSTSFEKILNKFF